MGIGGRIVFDSADNCSFEDDATSRARNVSCNNKFKFCSMLVYYKKCYVNFSVAALIGAGFMIGDFIGTHFATVLLEHILKKICWFPNVVNIGSRKNVSF